MDIQEKKDEELAALVQAGNVELFNVLVQRYEGKIKRYAAKVLSSSDDIQDVVQDIFIKAYVNIQSFDTARRFSPWIYRIAHNEIVNLFKRNKLRNFLPLLEPDILFPRSFKGSDEISKRVEAGEMKNLMDRYLSKLENKYKEPIVLYYIEELSYQEISEILHLPLATVGTRIRRGREMLKKIVKQQEHGA